MHTLPFFVTVAGLAVGSYVASRVARKDAFAMFGWSAAGAIPGVALLVGEPVYMLTLAVVLPLLAIRHRRTQHAQG